jgi:hypothetical protein
VEKENDMWRLGASCMHSDVVFVSGVPGRDFMYRVSTGDARKNEALFSFEGHDWKAFFSISCLRSHKRRVGTTTEDAHRAK